MSSSFEEKTRKMISEQALKSLLKMLTPNNKYDEYDYMLVYFTLSGLGRSFLHPDLKSLSSLHGFKWFNMDPDFAREVKEKTLEVCGFDVSLLTPSNIIDVEATPVAAKPPFRSGGFLDKMLSKGGTLQ